MKSETPMGETTALRPEEAETALRAFKALRADVEQFDSHEPNGDSGLFSEKVPLPMKSYLVNWLRRFALAHGDAVEAALTVAANQKEPE